MEPDEEYMRRALALAERGVGWVSPNPMVGAVIVKEGRVIGEGWHQKCGGLHAERNALAACAEPTEGATLYVTLEPCCHWGRTPPCTDAILESGIRRVVIGSADPNPLVSGRGAAILAAQGIQVEQGVLRAECDSLNAVFFHYIQHKTPYVVLKYAMTMDGKLATHTGASRWITGPAARTQVQQSRHRYTGILVGVGTVLADDPLLTCRLPGLRSPVRIVCDSTLRTPLTARLVATAQEHRTVLATCCTSQSRQLPYREAGCEIVEVPAREGRVDLALLMEKLGEMGVDSILLEGGAQMHWAALEAGVVRRVQAYIAPKLFGGAEAKSPVGGVGVALPAEAVRLSVPKVTLLDGDILLESEVL